MADRNTETMLKIKTKDLVQKGAPGDISTGRNVMKYDKLKEDNLAERIIADGNELPVSFLERGANIQKCVARVVVPAERAWGTGFLISPSMFMTNNHVLPTKEAAATAQVEFNYQMDLQGRPTKVDSYTTNVDNLFYTNSKDLLDFTIIRLNDKQGHAPGDKWGHCTLKEIPIAEKQYCNIIQHPSARYKEVALQENHIEKIFNDKVRYTTDTEPGSSGSPVFDNSWELICLHHSAGDRDPQNPDIWLNNEGINIAYIRADLISHFQGDSTGRSTLTELGLLS